MKTVIINGANGYVASNFICNLLKQDYKVIALVRANKQDPEDRMNDALANINEGIEIDYQAFLVAMWIIFILQPV
jgi:nucleoside-diphosphate-sugar epimerase